MELKGERLLPTDRATAWAALNDVEILKLCIPGCESITATAGGQYEIALMAAIGPVKARFKGKMEIVDVDAPNGYTLKFDGSGGQAGFARGDAKVALAVVDATSTKMTYLATAQIGGKLAQIGSRLVDAASAATADKFFEAFAEQLRARKSGGAAAGTPVGTASGTAAGTAGGAAPRPVSIGLFSLLWAMLRRLLRRSR
jgi:carbon monoxide dehydrogenase subunit G